MKLTEHAKVRFQQRGFSYFLLDIIQKYGRYEKASHGAIKVFLGKKEINKLRQELKRAIQLLDKSEGGTLIIKGGHVITLYKQKY